MRLLACLLFVAGASMVWSEETAGPVYKGGRAEALTQQAHTALPTVTVRGFLNFRTTVDGTVIVFTPASDGKPTATSAARPSSSTTAAPQPQTTNVLGFEIVGGGANEVLPPPTPTSTQPSSTSTSSRRRPSSTSSRSSSSRPQYPTGLVTVLGGTHVHRGVTTIHETKVIGTYIDGKYAQILQSTSRLVSVAPSAAVSSTPTAAFRAPEATPAVRLPKLEPSPSPKHQHVVRSDAAKATREERLRARKLGDTSSAALQSSFRSPEPSSSRQLFPRRTQSLPGSRTSRYRAVSREPLQSDLEDNTIVVTRGRHQQQRHTPLLAAAGTRLRYVPARNTHTVRLNRFKVRLTARPDAPSEPSSAEEEPAAATPSSTTSAAPTAEASDDVDPLVSIDPARVRYEPTTLTSLVTLHAAQGKSVVRTLTITTLHLTAIDSGEEQTPPLVVSRVYSTTEHSWRTSLVPVFDGLATTTHTLTESFIIRKIVTAYRTMPPGDLLAFDERNVTLDLDSEQYFQTLLNGAAAPPPPTAQQQPRTQEASYLALPSDGDQPVQLANPLLNAAFSNNPLAAVYLGLQQLNQQATLYSTVTQSSVYTTTDTVFHTKLVSFYDGRRTRTRTLSESLSTTERTLTNYVTSVVPYLNTQALQLQQLQQQQLQQLIGTQLGVVPTQPPAPRYTTVTSTHTTVTTATSYSSKIYTLIYNAFSTRYRTVTSSSSYVTTLTVTSTSSYLVQPTAPPAAAFAPQQLLLPPTVAPGAPSQPVAAA
ncbi:hypothetical protein MTO96_047383 [Rhipicephalus appendiculatus]